MAGATKQEDNIQNSAHKIKYDRIEESSWLGYYNKHFQTANKSYQNILSMKLELKLSLTGLTNQ